MRRILLLTALSTLLVAAVSSSLAQTTDINSSPSSLSFPNTYVGKASGSKVLTINNLTTSGQVIITSIGFTCPGFGISSGVAPFTLGQGQKITHYSIFFQPLAAQSYNCTFVINIADGTSLNVPISGLGLTSTATASVSPSTLTFTNQTVGVTSTPQTVTITNTGTTALTLNSITLSPPSFTASQVTLPFTINAGANLPVSVFYTPGQVTSETGAIDFSYSSIPDNGSSLTGNAVSASSLTIQTQPALPQATQSSAYQATLVATGGTGPYTWAMGSGSNLPLGLTLSSSGVISGTLDPSVNAVTFPFTIQVTDTATSATSSKGMTLTVLQYLGDNCADLSFNVPNTSTPMVALTDLGTGTYEGSQGGLYPNGSNVRPASHDADGVALAQGIQPLDANGNPSPTGKYVLMAIGESTAQNEFNRFLPIALADPAKNPNLVIVNGAQGGATPNNFTTTTSAYWATVLNNYLPQNGVTPNQVVAIWMEDTDGIATGSFPSDITTMQGEYETVMQTMHTLFPNLKLIYFSSRVYGGYSNGVGKPDNPEPYAYEVGFAVKWAIQDQLNGNANLNYNPALGPVVAPWMSWGPYYWSNGMLGRNDGLIWDCADFSADGTHPSSTYGQLKVATPLLNFLKTDDTTIPWYLAPNLALTTTSGNNQTGGGGTTLASPLTVLASNLNGGAVQTGVSVTFNDGGAGGTFGTPVATTDSTGTATTTYTLPATAKTVAITATSSNYKSASFTETSTNSQSLGVSAGNNQVGAPGTLLASALVVQALSNGSPISGVSVTFSDGGVGGVFGTPVATTDSNGLASTTYTLPATAQVVTISATSSGYTSTSFSETAANLQALSVNTGNNQTGGVSTTLPTALSVLATINGTPIPGVSVSFNDGGVGGTFSNPTATTDANGMASTTYTLPANAQTVTVTASSSGYASASFTENAVVQSITVNAGNNQNGNVSTTLPTALTILATSNGVPASGVSVAFSDGGVGGIFGSPTATTDSNGLASSTYTLPSTAQTVTVTVTSSGYTSATFTETAAVEVLAPTAGNNQTGNLGTTLPNSLTVQATVNGVPTSGVSVTFNDGGAGGSFGSPVVTTDSNGNATTTYTLPSTAKTVNITASALGYTSASLTETSAVLTLSPTAGNNQTGSVGVTLPVPLNVTATNNGTLVSGATVTFSDGGAGGTFSTPVATTNSSGMASTTYTPNTTGTITITASSPGYATASFTETIGGGVATLTVVSGGKQSGTVGSTLPLAIVIKAKNSSGQIVSGASITFSDGSTGSFSPNPAITGTNGQASVTYTLPKVPKTYTVTGTSGTASVRVTESAVIGPPTTFLISNGNNQTAHPNTTLPKQLVVKLTDQYNNPIPNATVTFTDNGAGGTFSTTTPLTNNFGQASVTYTTGSSTGTVTINATTSTLPALSFKESVK